MDTNHQTAGVVEATDLEKPYGVIYLVTNAVNGKRYVGQTTTTIHDRWVRGHLSKARTNASNTILARAITKYGEDAFSVVEIDRADSKEELDYMERYWIGFYRTMERDIGYNLKEGGARGKLASEICDQIAKTLTGRKLPKGHPFTMSRVSVNRGKSHSLERRHRQSAMIRAKYAAGEIEIPASKRPAVPVECVETGQQFPNRMVAARHLFPDATAARLRCISGAIGRATQDPRYSAYDLHWKEVG